MIDLKTAYTMFPEINDSQKRLAVTAPDNFTFLILDNNIGRLVSINLDDLKQMLGQV